MNKKIFMTLLLTSLIILFSFSYSLAANNVMNNTKNTIMNTGNSVSNAVMDTKNTITNSVQNTANGARNLGQEASNMAKNTGNTVKDAANNTVNTLENGDNNYNATRTSANNNMLGLSDNTWLWLILGIVGIVIVGLVWYYGAQYEHKNYDND